MTIFGTGSRGQWPCQCHYIVPLTGDMLRATVGRESEREMSLLSQRQTKVCQCKGSGAPTSSPDEHTRADTETGQLSLSMTQTERQAADLSLDSSV